MALHAATAQVRVSRMDCDVGVADCCRLHVDFALGLDIALGFFIYIIHTQKGWD